MIILKSFIAKELIAFLEREFVASEPKLQEVFLNDVAHEVKVILEWVNNKIAEFQQK